MLSILRDLDRLLRGDFTRAAQLRAGRIDVPWLQLVLGGLLCGAFYGACMGIWAAGHNLMQITQLQWVLSGAVKVPMLFLLTLVVTFPSLYVFSALADGCLRLGATLRLLLGAVGVQMALLAGFAPITVFFTVFTQAYAFMVALNVLFFGLSGLISLGFLARAVRIVFGGEPRDEEPSSADGAQAEPAPATAAPADAPPDTSTRRPTEPTTPASPDTQPGDAVDPPPRELPATLGGLPLIAEPGPRPDATPLRFRDHADTRLADEEDASSSRARRVFRVWLVIYGVVGAQMGWVLRPFIGDPTTEFAWSRDAEGHVFRALGDMLRGLFGT